MYKQKDKDRRVWPNENAYDLCVCPYRDLDPDNYFTISAFGITHYFHGDVSLTSLDRWLAEKKMFLALREKRSFRNFREIKYLRLWKTSMQRKSMQAGLSSISKTLLLARPSFLSVLLHCRGVTIDIVDVAKLVVAEEGEVYSLREFVEMSRRRAVVSRQLLHRATRELSLALLRVCRATAEYVQSATMFGSQGASAKAHAIMENAQLHGRTRMLSNALFGKGKSISEEGTYNLHRLKYLVRLVDYYSVESLGDIALAANEAMLRLVCGTEAITPEDKEKSDHYRSLLPCSLSDVASERLVEQAELLPAYREKVKTEEGSLSLAPDKGDVITRAMLGTNEHDATQETALARPFCGYNLICFPNRLPTAPLFNVRLEITERGVFMVPSRDDFHRWIEDIFADFAAAVDRAPRVTSFPQLATYLVTHSNSHRHLLLGKKGIGPRIRTILLQNELYLKGIEDVLGAVGYCSDRIQEYVAGFSPLLQSLASQESERADVFTLEEDIKAGGKPGAERFRYCFDTLGKQCELVLQTHSIRHALFPTIKRQLFLLHDVLPQYTLSIAQSLGDETREFIQGLGKDPISLSEAVAYFQLAQEAFEALVGYEKDAILLSELQEVLGEHGMELPHPTLAVATLQQAQQGLDQLRTLKNAFDRKRGSIRYQFTDELTELYTEVERESLAILKAGYAGTPASLPPSPVKPAKGETEGAEPVSVVEEDSEVSEGDTDAEAEAESYIEGEASEDEESQVGVPIPAAIVQLKELMGRNAVLTRKEAEMERMFGLFGFDEYNVEGGGIHTKAFFVCDASAQGSNLRIRALQSVLQWHELNDSIRFQPLSEIDFPVQLTTFSSIIREMDAHKSRFTSVLSAYNPCVHPHVQSTTTPKLVSEAYSECQTLGRIVQLVSSLVSDAFSPRHWELLEGILAITKAQMIKEGEELFDLVRPSEGNARDLVPENAALNSLRAIATARSRISSRGQLTARGRERQSANKQPALQLSPFQKIQAHVRAMERHAFNEGIDFDSDVVSVARLIGRGIYSKLSLVKALIKQADSELQLGTVLERVLDTLASVEVIMAPDESSSVRIQLLSKTDTVYRVLETAKTDLTALKARYARAKADRNQEAEKGMKDAAADGEGLSELERERDRDRDAPVVKRLVQELKRVGFSMEVFSTWVQVQTLWKHAATVLGNSNIQRQLPKVSKTFQAVDVKFQSFMHGAVTDPRLTTYSTASHLNRLTGWLQTLEGVRRAVVGYLDTERLAFPRFFFLSDDQLLDLVVAGRDPRVVVPYMRSMYQAISSLSFEAVKASTARGKGKSSARSRPSTAKRDSIPTTILSVHSGPEDAPLSEKLTLMMPLRLRGALGHWLTSLEGSVRDTLHQTLQIALSNYTATPYTEWIFNYPSQIVFLARSIAFHSGVGAIVGGGGTQSPKAYLVRELREQQVRIDSLCSLCTPSSAEPETLDTMTSRTQSRHRRDKPAQKDLSPRERNLLESVILMEMEWREILAKAVIAAESGVADVSAVWLDCPRFAYDAQRGEVTVEQSGTSSPISYSWEFTGHRQRLVSTPLTQRCIHSLCLGFSNSVGTMLSGPVSCGKTETIKDISAMLGRMCVVFDCSPSMDAGSVYRLFSGICMLGAVGVLDNVQMLSADTICVVAGVVEAVQKALRIHASSVLIGNRECALKPTVGITATTLPFSLSASASASDSKASSVQGLPSHLLGVFRPVSMEVPDTAVILEGILVSKGYVCAEELAAPVVKTLTLLHKSVETGRVRALEREGYSSSADSAVALSDALYPSMFLIQRIVEQAAHYMETEVAPETAANTARGLPSGSVDKDETLEYETRSLKAGILHVLTPTLRGKEREEDLLKGLLRSELPRSGMPITNDTEEEYGQYGATLRTSIQTVCDASVVALHTSLAEALADIRDEERDGDGDGDGEDGLRSHALSMAPSTVSSAPEETHPLSLPLCGHQFSEPFAQAVSRLHRLLTYSSGVIIVGPPGCGKTSVWKCLDALYKQNEKPQAPSNPFGLKVKDELNESSSSLSQHVTHLYPGAIGLDRLFGHTVTTHSGTEGERETEMPDGEADPTETPKGERDGEREWHDGVLPSAMRERDASGHSSDRMWYVFDGSFESDRVNSLLDDRNRLLLGNMETLHLQPKDRLIFEVTSLDDVSPALVARCSVLNIAEDTVSAGTRIGMYVSALLGGVESDDSDSEMSDSDDDGDGPAKGVPSLRLGGREPSMVALGGRTMSTMIGGMSTTGSVMHLEEDIDLVQSAEEALNALVIAIEEAWQGGSMSSRGSARGSARGPRKSARGVTPTELERVHNACVTQMLTVYKTLVTQDKALSAFIFPPASEDSRPSGNTSPGIRDADRAKQTSSKTQRISATQADASVRAYCVMAAVWGYGGYMTSTREREALGDAVRACASKHRIASLPLPTDSGSGEDGGVFDLRWDTQAQMFTSWKSLRPVSVVPALPAPITDYSDSYTVSNSIAGIVQLFGKANIPMHISGPPDCGKSTHLARLSSVLAGDTGTNGSSKDKESVTPLGEACNLAINSVSLSLSPAATVNETGRLAVLEHALFERLAGKSGVLSLDDLRLSESDSLHSEALRVLFETGYFFRGTRMSRCPDLTMLATGASSQGTSSTSRLGSKIIKIALPPPSHDFSVSVFDNALGVALSGLSEDLQDLSLPLVHLGMGIIAGLNDAFARRAREDALTRDMDDRVGVRFTLQTLRQVTARMSLLEAPALEAVTGDSRAVLTAIFLGELREHLLPYLAVEPQGQREIGGRDTDLEIFDRVVTSSIKDVSTLGVCTTTLAGLRGMRLTCLSPTHTVTPSLRPHESNKDEEVVIEGEDALIPTLLARYNTPSPGVMVLGVMTVVTRPPLSVDSTPCNTTLLRSLIECLHAKADISFRPTSGRGCRERRETFDKLLLLAAFAVDATVVTPHEMHLTLSGGVVPTTDTSEYDLVFARWRRFLESTYLACAAETGDKLTVLHIDLPAMERTMTPSSRSGLSGVRADLAAIRAGRLDLPNMFKDQAMERELSSLYEKIASDAVSAGVDQSEPSAVHAMFCSRVRSHLIIVTEMTEDTKTPTPTCDGERVIRLRPNTCTDLPATARAILRDVLGDRQKESETGQLAMLLAQVYVTAITGGLPRETGGVAVSVDAFSRFVNLCAVLYQRNTDTCDRERGLYAKGIDRVQSVVTRISGLKESLGTNAPHLQALQDSVTDAKHALVSRTEELGDLSKIIEERTADLKNRSRQLSHKAAVVDREMASVDRRLESALEAVAELTKEEIESVAEFTSPPPFIVQCMAAVCMMLGTSSTWSSAKVLLSDPDLLKRSIEGVDKRSLCATDTPARTVAPDRRSSSVSGAAETVLEALEKHLEKYPDLAAAEKERDGETDRTWTTDRDDSDSDEEGETERETASILLHWACSLLKYGKVSGNVAPMVASNAKEKAAIARERLEVQGYTADRDMLSAALKEMKASYAADRAKLASLTSEMQGEGEVLSVVSEFADTAIGITSNLRKGASKVETLSATVLEDSILEAAAVALTPYTGCVSSADMGRIEDIVRKSQLCKADTRGERVAELPMTGFFRSNGLHSDTLGRALYQCQSVPYVHDPSHTVSDFLQKIGAPYGMRTISYSDFALYSERPGVQKEKGKEKEREREKGESAQQGEVKVAPSGGVQVMRECMERGLPLVITRVPQDIPADIMPLSSIVYTPQDDGDLSEYPSEGSLHRMFLGRTRETALAAEKGPVSRLVSSRVPRQRVTLRDGNTVAVDPGFRCFLLSDDSGSSDTEVSNGFFRISANGSGEASLRSALLSSLVSDQTPDLESAYLKALSKCDSVTLSLNRVCVKIVKSCAMLQTPLAAEEDIVPLQNLLSLVAVRESLESDLDIESQELHRLTALRESAFGAVADTLAVLYTSYGTYDTGRSGPSLPVFLSICDTHIEVAGGQHRRQ
ncbi:dynein heavy chain 6, axonemal, partial [Kipferlia bialata]|eukprot:g1403.t1